MHRVSKALAHSLSRGQHDTESCPQTNTKDYVNSPEQLQSQTNNALHKKSTNCSLISADTASPKAACVHPKAVTLTDLTALRSPQSTQPVNTACTLPESTAVVL